jgi:predicted metalloprotease
MKLDDLKPSDNFEDRRGSNSGFGFPGGPGSGRRINIPMGGGRGGMSFGTIIMLVIVYFVVKLVFGVDLLQMLNGGGGINLPGTETTDTGTGTGTTTTTPGSTDVTGDAGSTFVRQILTSTEIVWGDIFKKEGQTYPPPKLVLFNGLVQSACGRAQAAMGPFYCPGDQRVYIDLSFYQDLRDKLGAPGDFAQGYVIAHEVGHHIQNLVGTADKVQRQRERASEADSNALSVRMELQADCYAGVWGNYMNKQNRLDAGDLEEALTAAAAIGDDRLQKQSQGYAVPDSFTHGTSAQRVKWFKRGFDSGNPDSCDTFTGNP